MGWLDNLDPLWAWFALGLFLAVAEMAVPGVFLIWLAAAAIVTGVLAWTTPIGLSLQIVVFAVLAILAVFTGRRYLRDNPIIDADPLMNRRVQRMVGEAATVCQPIAHGNGKVKLGDSEWLARGPDMAVGASVRVVGAEGAVLLVEPLP